MLETDISTPVEKTWNPLIDGMHYLGFQPLLAKEIGVNETLFLNHIHNWLQVSKNKRDGFIWVYKTYDEWQAELPFWSVDTIKRTIKKLEKAELVISTGKYNRLGFDKTKWYTINYEKINQLAIEILSGQNAQTGNADCIDDDSNMHRGTEQNATIHDSELHKQSGQNAQMDDSKLPQTIPLNNTLNNSLNQSNNTFMKKQTEKTDRQSFSASSISNTLNREEEKTSSKDVGRSVPSLNETNSLELKEKVPLELLAEYDDRLERLRESYEFSDFGEIDHETSSTLRIIAKQNKDNRLIGEAVNRVKQQESLKSLSQKPYNEIMGLLSSWKNEGIYTFKQLESYEKELKSQVI